MTKDMASSDSDLYLPVWWSVSPAFPHLWYHSPKACTDKQSVFVVDTLKSTLKGYHRNHWTLHLKLTDVLCVGLLNVNLNFKKEVSYLLVYLPSSLLIQRRIAKPFPLISCFCCILFSTLKWYPWLSMGLSCLLPDLKFREEREAFTKECRGEFPLSPAPG